MDKLLEIKSFLLRMTPAERRKLLPGVSENDFKELLSSLSSMESLPNSGNSFWADKILCGLSKEGIKHLKEMEEQSQEPSSHIDRKQLRYLRSLKKMKLDVPHFFRESVDPKQLYNRLKSFCVNHDIPEEIISRVVPAFVSYIDTGHMRPIIFVGEKGCGKTTAVRMLIEEALRIPTYTIKVPQTDGGHGMTGDCGTFQSADAGDIAKARLRFNSLLVGFIVDEIDKVPHYSNRSSIDDELLSITDESNSDVFDNYLETTLIGLEHCPMFFTANDLQKVNPILADRCTIIRFPNASVSRIKSISKKYADKMLASRLYSTIEFDYDLMFQSVERLANHNVTSLRKHQQMIEAVLEDALETAFSQEGDGPVAVTESMFAKAERDVLGTVERRAGF